MLVFYFFHYIFVTDKSFKFILECTQLLNYQNMLHYHYLHSELSTEIQLVFTHQELLCIPYTLSQVSYFYLQEFRSEGFKKLLKVNKFVSVDFSHPTF